MVEQPAQRWVQQQEHLNLHPAHGPCEGAVTLGKFSLGSLEPITFLLTKLGWQHLPSCVDLPKSLGEMP